MKKSRLIYIFMILGFTSVFAQTEEEKEGEKDNTDAFTVGVEIGRTVFIQDAKKLSIPVQIDKITVLDPEYTYEIAPKLFELDPYYSEPIQPIQLGDVKMPELKPGYAVLGFGNYRNAVGELYWNSGRDRKKYYDINLKHRSGKAPARFSGFGNTTLDANYEKIYSKHTLKLNLDAGYQRVHHYGFYSDSIPESININPDTILTDYFHVGVNAFYDNYKSRGEKHKYQVYAKPYYFMSSQGQFEWAAIAGGTLREPLKDNMFLDFDVEYDYNAYYSNDLVWNRNIVRIGANYKYQKDGLNVKAGFKTASDNVTPPGDTVGSENNIYIFPDVKASYTFGDNVLQAYANIGGGLHKNSLRSVAQTNPFINSDLRLQNTIERLNISGGFKGNLFRELNYNLYVGYRNLNRMLLFANIDSTMNYFSPIYSASNTGITNFGAELNYTQYERLFLSLRTNYYQYSFVNDLAWNMPTFDLRLSAKYNFQEKIIAYADVFAINSRQGTNLSKSKTFDMEGAIDISLGADYQFNSKTYFYARVNNILHQKYMMWNGYPVQGFHLLAGVKMEF
jgi:hypothetical protein